MAGIFSKIFGSDSGNKSNVILENNPDGFPMDARVVNGTPDYFVEYEKSERKDYIIDLQKIVEKRLEDNVGIIIFQGGLALKDNDYFEHPEKYDAEEVRSKLEGIFKACLQEFKIAFDYLETVNERNRQTPVMRAFDELSRWTGKLDKKGAYTLLRSMKSAQENGWHDKIKHYSKKNIKYFSVLERDFSGAFDEVVGTLYLPDAIETVLAIIEQAIREIFISTVSLREARAEIADVCSRVGKTVISYSNPGNEKVLVDHLRRKYGNLNDLPLVYVYEHKYAKIKLPHRGVVKEAERRKKSDEIDERLKNRPIEHSIEQSRNRTQEVNSALVENFSNGTYSLAVNTGDLQLQSVFSANRKKRVIGAVP